jgi:hypothetical protein
MNIVRTLGFAAAAALSLGIGAAMAQEGGGSDAAAAGSPIEHFQPAPWAPAARVSSTAVQSGSSDVEGTQPAPAKMLPGNYYGNDSAGAGG